MEYRFYMRDPLVSMTWTQVEEPEGWDALEETLQRSDAYTGMDNLYSSDLLFSLEGADFLIDKFELYRFDGHIDFKAELYCNQQLTSTITGIINLITYREENHRVSVSFEDTGFQRKFLNRIQTPINLSDELSIEGVNIGALVRNNIPFHSKEIFYTGEYNIDPALRDLTIIDRPNSHTTPWHLLSGDVIGMTEPTTLEPTGAGRAIIVNNGTLEQNITISGRVIISPLTSIFRNDSNTYTYTGGFNYLYSDSDGSHVIYSTPGIIQGSANTYDFSFDINVRLAPGDSCILTYFDAYEETLPGTGTISRNQHYIYGSECSLSLEELSLFPTSTVDTYKIYEVLNKVVESITDRTDAIRSDFFGRTDSVPHVYTEDGCGSQAAYTNGLNIRNMLDNTGNPFDITANFLQLFNCLNVHNSIGFAIEKIGGIPYVRIEPKEYFYNNTPIKTFNNVSDLAKSVATEYAWNEIEIGYSQWEVENINGIDEFNTKHIYTFPVKNINKRLTLLTDIICGGYAIEMTRRQQYNNEPTTDWKYDNNGFIISLNRISQTFDTQEENPYHQDGDTYPKTYPVGTITERNEMFLQVDGVISPETSYNLRYSPSRCMVNNYRYVAGTISHNPSLPLKFQSGTGNIVMLTEMDDVCDNVNGAISENQDIISDNLDTDDKFAYFEPLKLEFTFPMDRVEFESIKANQNRSIVVSCSDSNNIQATIKELKYTHNTEGGIATVTALASTCIDGAYDSGFDESFDIGSC